MGLLFPNVITPAHPSGLISGQTGLIIVIAIAIAVIAFMYLVAPLIVRAKQSIAAKVSREIVELEQLPHDVAARLVEVQQALASEGFALAVILQDRRVTNATGYISLLNHSNLLDQACIRVVETLPQGAVPRRVICVVAFERYYLDGESIGAANTRYSGFHPRDPLSHDLAVPQIRNPVILWRIHCARVVRLSSKIRAAPRQVQLGREIEDLEANEQRSMRRAVNAGLYYLDEQSSRYRKTLKGAYLMCWKLLPPIKQIVRWKLERRARMEMRSLPQHLLQNASTPMPLPATIRTTEDDDATSPM